MDTTCLVILLVLLMWGILMILAEGADHFSRKQR